MSGELLLGPDVLVPAPAAHPGALRHFRSGLTHPADDLVVRWGGRQVHLLQRAAKAGKVGVGIDQPGGDGAAGQVDHLGLRTAKTGGARVGTEVDDTAAAHGETALDAARGLHRVKHPVLQDEVGTVLCKGGSDGRQDRQTEQKKRY